MNFEKGEVVIFKTVSGMDYIGVLEDYDDLVYSVKNILSVVPNNTSDGGVHIGLGASVHPSVGVVDKRAHGAVNVELNRVIVAFLYEPQEELVKTYNQAVTGIEIATAMPGRL
jgi:hypothetical protein